MLKPATPATLRTSLSPTRGSEGVVRTRVPLPVSPCPSVPSPISSSLGDFALRGHPNGASPSQANLEHLLARLRRFDAEFAAEAGVAQRLQEDVAPLPVAERVRLLVLEDPPEYWLSDLVARPG
jgi:hypothetical protein